MPLRGNATWLSPLLAKWKRLCPMRNPGNLTKLNESKRIIHHHRHCSGLFCYRQFSESPPVSRPRVCVGVSGGVDSAVTALLMCEKHGRDRVTGVFMRNWDARDEEQRAGSGTQPQCDADRELESAQAVCDHLGIRLVEANFVQQYWTRVFEPFLAGLKQGLTPNPDVECNARVKFRSFLEYARVELHADIVATGHYARLVHDDANKITGPRSSADDAGLDMVAGKLCDTGPWLYRAADRAQDQTYFLAGVHWAQFSPGTAVQFPLGWLTKQQVRDRAARAGLAMVANKKTSTGLCFVGPRKFGPFVAQFIDLKPGDFVDVDTGRRIGQHQGLAAVTVGQRARVGGLSCPYFVCGKRVPDNVALVCAGSDHPALYSSFADVHPFNWLTQGGKPPDQLDQGANVGAALDNSLQFRAQIRYRHQSQCCSIERLPYSAGESNGTNSHFTSNPVFRVHFAKPMKAVTPGQVLVLYDREHDSVCYGSAIIA